jgi:hypothetical protein
MLLAYSIPIFYVYFYFADHSSISAIIGSDACQQVILISMIVMGFLTLLYERERKDTISFYFILFLLIGIYGVILINESNLHYVFASLVFFSILGFMIHHTKKHQWNGLRLLLLISTYFAMTTIAFFHKNIFLSEACFIGTFAVFYLFLHWI